MASYRTGKLVALVTVITLAFLVVVLEPVAAQSPTIEHMPPASAHLGSAMTIQARVTDDGTVTSVDLYYRGVADSDFFKTAMTLAPGGAYGPSDPNAYVATIPAQQSPGQVMYYIMASDDQGNVARSPTTGDYTVSVSATPAPVMIDPLILSYIIVPIVVVVGVVTYFVLRRRRTRTPPGPR